MHGFSTHESCRNFSADCRDGDFKLTGIGTTGTVTAITTKIVEVNVMVSGII